jgi:hypothetical protein
MPKREAPDAAPDGAADGQNPYGRHPAVSEEIDEVREQVQRFAEMTTPMLLSQLTGTAARLQLVSAAIRFPLGSSATSAALNRRFLEELRDMFHVVLPALTEAVTTFLALEDVLSSRYMSFNEELDSLPSSQRPRLRRRT